MTLLRLAASVCVAACVAAPALNVAWATTPPPAGDTAGPQVEGNPEPEIDGTPAPVVRGFRSASFGMDESAVRRAIFEDFELAGSAVERTRNDLEQTTVLTVAVPELVPDAGPATITYVLGRAGTLIQVTILWGLGQAAIDAESLQTTARILIEFFDSQGFASQIGPEPMVFVDGSNLLYYARGAEGGGLALSALPRQNSGEGDETTQADRPPVLRLAYAADLANPDVFRAPAIRP